NMIYIQVDKKTDFSKIPTPDKYKFIAQTDTECNEHKIIKDSADFFLIVPFFGTDNQHKQMWFKKTDLIKINIRKSSGKISLRFAADTNSMMMHVFDISEKKLFDKSVTVLNCKTGWYRIELNLDGQKYRGWIKSNDLCPNPCSTCG
ncbi:MAG TPA: hypothetical protein VNX01_06280, partial [Bacteroidia bacterium]|nr:hypothetical protein [Bacteroidia bacterium]